MSRIIAQSVLLLAVVALATPASAFTTFVVNHDGDLPDGDLVDPACDNGNGKCTLRAAIEQANATADPGGTLITFAFGNNKKTIAPLSFLPTITADFVTVSDVGSGTEITLDGVNVGAVRGLEIRASFCAIQGLHVRGWGTGILIQGLLGTHGNNLIGTDGDGVDDEAEGNVVFGNASTGVAAVDSDDNVIAGNTIGLKPNGAVDGNEVGVSLVGSGVGLSGNVVGTNGDGTGDAAEGNVISGNDFIGVFVTQDAVANTVAGNFIGTNAAGTLARSNGTLGIWVQLRSDGNTIGTNGDGVSDALEGNVISANTLAGIQVSTSDANVIAGNRIGTDVTGTQGLGNGGAGVSLVASNFTRIGTNADGTSDGLEGNVISDNAFSGISLLGTNVGASNGVISGNAIGTDPLGAIDLGNGGYGIVLQPSSGGTQGNLIGGELPAQANRIAYNALDGIILFGPPPASDNSILRNSIHQNGGLGIAFGETAPTANDRLDLDAGPNDRMNHPIVTQASSNGLSTFVGLEIQQGLPNRSFRVQVFASPACDPSGFGEGRTYLGERTLTTDASGNAALANTSFGAATPVGHVITATATATGIGFGSTSEFSPCRVVDASQVVNFILANKALLLLLLQQNELRFGQYNALDTKLDAALRSIDRGRYRTAVNQLRAFIRQVRVFERRRVLDARDADTLIEGARSAIVAIRGGAPSGRGRRG